ncbi:MAG: efflux RND transporter periplasmic adaptor subunit [Rikenellaceae bacterium]
MKITLFLSILLLCSCASRSGVASGDRVRSIKVVETRAAEFVERDFVGLSTAMSSVRLSFRVSGQLLDIPVAKGDLVAAGELLARIDPLDIETQLQADRSAYEQSHTQLERVRRLLSHEAVSQQEVERAELSYNQSKALYINTKELLLQTSLRAPFDAIVERVYVDTYQRVQSGEAIMLIVTPTTSQVGFTLPESSLSAMLDSATRFEVRFDNIPDKSFAASVVEYARTSSDASGFPVTLSIDGGHFAIRSGMSCTITMFTPSASRGDILVPLSAIYAPAQGGTYLWVVDSVGRVLPRRVEVVSPISSSDVVVRSGVAVGEQVVVAGVYQLSDGQRVKVLK